MRGRRREEREGAGDAQACCFSGAGWHARAPGVPPPFRLCPDTKPVARPTRRGGCPGRRVGAPPPGRAVHALVWSAPPLPPPPTRTHADGELLCFSFLSLACGRAVLGTLPRSKRRGRAWRGREKGRLAVAPWPGGEQRREAKKKKREGEAPTRPRRRLPSPPPPLLSSISPPTHLPLSSRAGSFNYGGGNPMRPHRVRLTHSLVENYDLPKMLKVKKTMGGGGWGVRREGGCGPRLPGGGQGGVPPLFFFFSFSPAPPHTFSLLLSCL